MMIGKYYIIKNLLQTVQRVNHRSKKMPMAMEIPAVTREKVRIIVLSSARIQVPVMTQGTLAQTPLLALQ